MSVYSTVHVHPWICNLITCIIFNNPFPQISQVWIPIFRSQSIYLSTLWTHIWCIWTILWENEGRKAEKKSQKIISFLNRLKRCMEGLAVCENEVWPHPLIDTPQHSATGVDTNKYKLTQYTGHFTCTTYITYTIYSLL